MYILKRPIASALSRLLTAAVLAACTLRAADLPSMQASTSSSIVIRHAAPSGSRLWFSSIGAIAAASALDIASSVGKHELNPTLSGPNGSISAQGALIKLGIQSGIIGIECLALRHHPSPRLYRAFSFINFGDTAVTAAVAAHNYTVPRTGAQ